MAIEIAGSNGIGISATAAANNSANVLLYAPDGSALLLKDKAANGIVPGANFGMPIIGADWETPRIARVMSDASWAGGRSLAFNDSVEGATLNTYNWTNTNTTFTTTQATGLITQNANSTLTGTTGSLLISQKSFPLLARGRLIMRSRQRHGAHFNNNLIEVGFGTTASATAAGIGTGAVWRKDGTGQYVPVISTVNGTETLGTPISNATFVAEVGTTSFAWFEVELAADSATFRIYTSLGKLIAEQVIDLEIGTGNFQATHVQLISRNYNNGVVTTAVQSFVGQTTAWMIDYDSNRSWPAQMSGLGLTALTSPTAYTQLANYANSAVPATGTPSNTAAGYTTLGGQFLIAAVGGAETDLAMFAFTNPSPYNLIITGLRISTCNTGAVVATTPTLLQWGVAFNAPAVTLAANTLRVAVGYQTALVGAAVGSVYAPDIDWRPGTPYTVYPGRLFHIILKVPVGTATASQLIRGVAVVDGYFE